LYAGDQWIPEEAEEDEIKTNGDFVASGRLYHFDGSEDYKEDFEDPDIGPSRHLTFLFNTFVFLQLFNEFNSRRIHDELNVFEGLWGDWLFVGIWVFTIVAQAIMV